VLRRVNALSDDCALDGGEPDGYLAGALRVSSLLGGEALAVKVFELPPGESVCPYHYEYEEEWLVLLDGAVTVRTPDGEQTLVQGEVVCFPPGPAGAHKVGNLDTRPARIMMFSPARQPAVAVYPDSDKIGVWPGNPDDQVMFHRADGAVDYWDGER